MNLIAIDGADYGLVELTISRHTGRRIPHCRLHGAMNKISASGYWRCITTHYEYGEWEETGIQKKGGGTKKKSKMISGVLCKAGCKETEQ